VREKKQFLLALIAEIIMAALRSRCGHHIFASVVSLWPPYEIGQAIIFLPCGFFLSSSSSIFSFFLA